MLSVAPTCQYTICAISLYAGRTVQNVKEEKKKYFSYLFYSTSRKGEKC